MSNVPVRSIGVIGAGQMGAGIVHVAAQAGFSVHMADIDETQLDAALATMSRNMDRQIQRGRMTEDDKAAALGRITTGSEYAAFADCDLVVEAATEDEGIKNQIFARLVPELREDALNATTTPCPRTS